MTSRAWLAVRCAMLFVVGLLHAGAQADAQGARRIAFAATTGRLVPPGNVYRAPALRVDAAPRSVQLVGVARPDAFGAEDSVAFRVVRTPGARVSGPESGVLAGTLTRVLLSVAVPSHARAGVQPSAEVHFRSLRSDSLLVIVPVELRVAPVYATSVTTSMPTVHVVQGRRARVPYQITNGGNTTDTVQLTLLLPPGWKGQRFDAHTVVLEPGESVTQNLSLVAPRDVLPGTALVQLTARRPVASESASASASASDNTQRTLRIPVDVISATPITTFGPVLGVSYSAVQQDGVDTQGSVGLTLNGPLAAGVSMNASWTQRAVFGTPGVSRVGGGQLFPTLALLHPKWQLQAGNAVSDLGDVGGLLRAGRGFSFAYGDTTWQVSAIAARPFTFDVPSELLANVVTPRTRSAGVLAGVRARLLRDGTAWTSGVSHLRDPLMLNASLSALTVGAERILGPAATARAELAFRRWDEGQGLGAAAELGQRGSNSDWRLRATHAPGGGLAFARAQTDVTLTGARRLGGMRLGYVGFYAADAGRSAVTQSTGGVGLMPQWSVGQGGSVGFEVRVNQSEQGAPESRVATMAEVLGGFGAARLGPLTATTNATYLRTTRALAVAGTEALRLREGQLTWSAQLLWPLAFGTIDAWSSLQRQLGADALADGQHDVTIRAERLAVPLTNGRVYASAAVGRTVSLGTGAQLFTQRVGLSAVLPFDSYVRIDMERNPFIRGNGATGWSTALRVERSFGTPSFLRGGRGTGTVFEDQNGNGVRDNNERGLPGVVVRVGGEVVVTDRGGVYQLARPGGGTPTIDERSLPFGLMVAPQVTRAAMTGVRDGAFDVPVVPVGAVDVRLELAANAVRPGAVMSWQGVRVFATDAAGRRHLALLLPSGVARFEALPPGEYQLGVDGSSAAEPLSLQGVAPRFRVNGDAAQQELRATVGPRQIRLFRAPPARTRTESGAGAGAGTAGAAGTAGTAGAAT